MLFSLQDDKEDEKTQQRLKDGQTDRQTNRQIDKKTDGQTDGWTDRQTKDKKITRQEKLKFPMTTTTTTTIITTFRDDVQKLRCSSSKNSEKNLDFYSGTWQSNDFLSTQNTPI